MPGFSLPATTESSHAPTTHPVHRATALLQEALHDSRRATFTREFGEMRGIRRLSTPDVSDEFVDWFSICGSPDKCRDRLTSIIDLGLDHVYLLGGSPVAHPHGERQAGMVQQTRLFAEQVLPQLK